LVTATVAAGIVAAVVIGRGRRPSPKLLQPSAEIHATAEAKSAILSNGVRIRLDAGTLKLASASKDRQPLLLQSARIFVDVPRPPPGSKLSVRTPDAEVRVHRTHFQVIRTNTETAEPARSRCQRALPAEALSVSVAPPMQRWPWIPTVIGSGAAVAAGICALLARNRYNALSDKSQPYDSASALKSEGENYQVASIVLSGVAVAGVATGVIGFATRSPARPTVAALVTPVPGGGMITVAGELP
jgi:hypothetical protein